MIAGPNDKILRDEAMRRIEKSEIMHSSGFVTNNGVTGGASSMTYKQRQEMLRQYVGDYNKSQLGAVRNPAMRAQAVEQKPGQRFDAHMRRRRP